MTTIPPQPPSDHRAALIRELAGVVLILVGVATVLGAAYAASTTLGVALTGACAVAAGVYLSLGKE